jgi:hypothetical protein
MVKLIGKECGPWAFFASYTLAFAFTTEEKVRKTSVRVAEEGQLALKTIYKIEHTLKKEHINITIKIHNFQN